MSSHDSIQETTTAACVQQQHSNVITTETKYHRCFFDRNSINLESHQLIFLNKNSTDSDQDKPIVTLEELRKIVDYTKVINNIEEALQYIDQTQKTTTFLVCSDDLGQIIVPQIHLLENIQSIYIYCSDKQYHKQWSTDYIKIKQSYINLQLLLYDLNHDVKQYLEKENNDIFSEVNRDNYTTDFTTFSWWNYFIFMISNLIYPDNCRQSFIMTLRDYYQGKQCELKVLDEFERTYTSEKAIWWYTRDTFIYRLLNRALRQKNMQVIFLFAFFIKDMYTRVKTSYENFKNTHIDNPIITVYRGQLMSLDEINTFNTSIISNIFINNSYFSTTLNRSAAVFLLDPSPRGDDELQNILFEIELDSRIISQPYGNISNLSAFSSEEEVLFAIGVTFEVVEYSYDNNTNIHIVKLKLEDDLSIKDNNYDNDGMTIRLLLKNFINEILSHLYQIGIDNINTLFDELSEIFFTEKVWLNAARYHFLSRLYAQFHIKHYPEYIDITLSTLEQALTMYQLYSNDKELDFTMDIIDIHRDISLVYDIYVKNNTLAKKHYDLGMNTGILSLQTMVNKQQRMDIYDRIVGICENKATIIDDETERKEIILDGIRYRELQLEEYLPSNHINFLYYIEHLADLQNSIGLFTESLMNYEKLVQIYIVQSELNFDKIPTIYGKISKTYIQQNENYTLALHFKQKELEFRLKGEKVRLSGAPNFIDSIKREYSENYEELADIYVQLSQYEEAYKNLITAKKICEDSDFYDKEEKNTIIDEKIRNIEQFLSQKTIN